MRHVPIASLAHSGTVLLDDRCPLPLDRPFTRQQAAALGVGPKQLRRAAELSLVREVVRGAYAVAQLRDTIELRAGALSLVVSDGAVVTDRTAAWLHGIDVLPRRAVHEPVPVDVFSAESSRLRRPGVEQWHPHAAGRRGRGDQWRGTDEHDPYRPGPRTHAVALRRHRLPWTPSSGQVSLGMSCEWGVHRFKGYRGVDPAARAGHASPIHAPSRCPSRRCGCTGSTVACRG